METRQQRIIREIVDGRGRPSDTSLRQQALAHTDADYLPRTLTAHEWEDWYARRGRPPQHGVDRARSPGLWQRLRSLFAGFSARSGLPSTHRDREPVAAAEEHNA